MTIREHTSTRKCDAGCTLIELIEVVAAIALGAWLADKVSSYFTGAWRTLVLWTIRTIGSGIIFLCFLYGFGYLLAYLERRKTQKTSDEKHTPNAA